MTHAPEHPLEQCTRPTAALWDWPERWGIEGLTPQKAFDDWYAAGGVGGSGTKHVQQCAWSPSKCNKLCPLWT